MDQKKLAISWKQEVNMTPQSLKAFLNHPLGKDAGLSKEKAEKLGIRRGRDSARAILRMKKKLMRSWTSKDWEWASHQVSFIRRMKKNRGFFIKDGQFSRKLKSLLIWGHDPLLANGGWQAVARQLGIF